MYDFINNQIEMIENTYKMVEQQAKALYTFDWENAANDISDMTNWSGDPNQIKAAWENIGKARENYRNINSYVSARLDSLDASYAAIMNQGLEIPGSDGNKKFTLGMLLTNGYDGTTGKQDPDKGWLGLGKSLVNYADESLQGFAAGFEGKLTAQEKYAIMTKYGMSPNTYYKTRIISDLSNNAIRSMIRGVGSQMKKEQTVEAEIQQTISAILDKAEAKQSIMGMLSGNTMALQVMIDKLDDLRIAIQEGTSLAAMEKYQRDTLSEIGADDIYHATGSWECCWEYLTDGKFKN